MEAINEITGGVPLTLFILYMCSCALGLAIFKTKEFNKRHKSARKTPQKASFWFWIRDNIDEALIHIGVCYAIVRFVPMGLEAMFPKMWGYIHGWGSFAIAFAIGSAFSIYCGGKVAVGINNLKRQIRKNLDSKNKE